MADHRVCPELLILLPISPREVYKIGENVQSFFPIRANKSLSAIDRIRRQKNPADACL